MKLLLSSIFLLFFATIVRAQTCTIYFTTIDTLPDGSILVVAHLTGTSPTYTWANGATGDTLQITEPGAYLVTATNAEGCSIGSGYVAECETYIRQEGNAFKAYKLLGGTGLTYLWDTGETTQEIYPTESGEHCVTVTGSVNCSGGLYSNSRCGYFYYVPSCVGGIMYNLDNTLSAYSTGLAPFTYQWSPGNYSTQTIDPGQPGEYCVTITDAAGCSWYSCRQLYDPAQCDVDLIFSPDSTTGGWLFAQTEGGWWGDIDYQWNTGEISPFIHPLTGGSYCVTITNVQTGCTSSNCYWYWPDSLCYAEIHLDSIGLNDAFLSVTGGPFNIVDYQWNNGGTAAINRTTTAGYQSVAVTNSEGCTASATYYLWLNESLAVNLLFPDSTAFGNNGIHALFYLIEYDTAQGGILTAIDTVENDIWSNAWAMARINDIPPGNYLLKAALLPNSNGYADYLPTYSQNDVFWTGATPVAFKTFAPNWQQVSILMVPGQNPGGPGFIGGLVSEGANLHAGSGGEFSGNGAPMAGVNVVLTLPNGDPVAATVTDANGLYSFSNIPWGAYTITIDIPGLPLVSSSVVIDTGNPVAQHINFVVDENSIALPVAEADLKSLVAVFPNPVQDVLYVETPENAGIALLDALGKTISSTVAVKTTTKLPVGDLASGVYLLTVRAGSTTEVIKVIKQ